MLQMFRALLACGVQQRFGIILQTLCRFTCALFRALLGS
jgi:hypothetical protein